MNRSLKFDASIANQNGSTLRRVGNRPPPKRTMDKEENNVGNCPHCMKVIFKDAIFNSEASFSTRCPHCNKAVRVIIKHKVEITLIAVQDERNPKKGPGPGIVIVILALYLPPIIHHVMDNMDNVIDLIT